MRCRTCLATLANPNNGMHLQKKLNFGKTIEEIILFCIPDMVKSNLVGDYICSNCLNSVQAFETFMKTVITIENYLKSRNVNVTEEFMPALVIGEAMSTVKIPIEEKMQLITVQTPTTVCKPIKTYSHKSVNPVSPAKEPSLVQSKPCVVTGLQNLIEETRKSTEECQTIRILIPAESVTKPQKQSKPRVLVTDLQNLIEETRKSTKECQEVINDANEFLVPLTDASNSVGKIINVTPKVESEVHSRAASDSVINPTARPMEYSFLDKSSNGNNIINLNHNRIIGISKRTTETAEICNKLCQNNVTVFEQSTLQNAPTKRILFLGTAFFPCPECKTQFPSYLTLKKHFVAFHPNSQCQLMEKNKFSDVIEYSSSTRVRQIACPFCDKHFKACRSMESHVLNIHKGYYLYSCKECGKHFNSKARYSAHMKNYKTYETCYIRTCSVCKEVVARHKFIDHVQIHRTLKCTKCQSKFCSIKNLNKHQLVHQKTTVKKKIWKKELCMICGKLIIGSSNMTHHLKTHGPALNLLCDKCPKSFTEERNLNKHIQRVHNNTRLYECKLCKQQTKCKESLTHHIRLKHSDTYTYICYICGSGFMREDYYKRHLTKHKDDSKLNYTNPHRKNIYTKRNENDPFFTCKYCQRKYKTVHQLRKHLLDSHLNKSRYKCRYCDMTFKSAPVRFKHEKRHQDPIAFELTCQICWCKFPDTETLELHSLRHVGSARQTCEICGEKFPSKFMLNHHKGKAHFNQEQLELERNILLEDGLREYKIEYQTVCDS